MDAPPLPRQSSAGAGTKTGPGALAPVVRSPPLGKPFAGVLAALRVRLAGESATAKPAPSATAKPAPGVATPSEVPGHGAIDAEKGSRGDREGEGAEGERAPHDDSPDLELLDPAARHAASLAPPMTIPTSLGPAASEAPLRARSLEELLPALVRRIAWAGDKHKGTVRLELGAGAYAGTTVVVHAEGGRVRVEISGTEGPELDRLRARLDGRLRGHGLDVESVT